MHIYLPCEKENAKVYCLLRNSTQTSPPLCRNIVISTVRCLSIELDSFDHNAGQILLFIADQKQEKLLLHENVSISSRSRSVFGMDTIKYTMILGSQAFDHPAFSEKLFDYLNSGKSQP